MKVSLTIIIFLIALVAPMGVRADGADPVFAAAWSQKEGSALGGGLMGPTTTCAGDKRVSCSSFSGRRQQGPRARLDHVMGNRHRLESAPLLPSVAQSQ